MGLIKSTMKNMEQRFLEGLVLTTSRHETQSSNSVGEYSDPPIPDDLLVEIFARVPAKSIARFRCVSKFLVSILRRHDFTELFLTKSLTRPRLLFTIEANDKFFFYSSSQPHNPDDNSSLAATPYHPTLALEPTYMGKPTYTCKHVCGLVLLQGVKRRQCPMICNPAKVKVQILPKVLKKEKTPKEIFLGYDPICKQFKVLCLSMKTSIPNTHWILTLESGKCLWRSVTPQFNFKENGEIHSDICINGVLYFKVKLEESFVIVCFDVRSEKFGFIDKDEDMLLPKPYGLYGSLFNYKDKLGIHVQNGQELVLWVLEDAGNHKWSKHSYVLSAFEWGKLTQMIFVGMTSTGEIVYWSCNSCVCFYNLETNTVKTVNIEMEGTKHLRFIDTFVDSVENMKFI